MGAVASILFILLPSCDVGCVIGWEYIYGNYTPCVHFGMMISTVFTPILMNHLGRRCSFLCMMFFLYLGLLLKLIFPTTWSMTVLSRILCGIGAGFYIQFILVYLSEMSPRRYRGRILIIPLTLISISIMAHFATEPYFPITVFVNLAFGILSLLGAFLFLHETPYFLLSVNEFCRAKIILSYYRTCRDDLDAELTHMAYEVCCYRKRLRSLCPLCAYQEMLERTAIILLLKMLSMMAFGGYSTFHIYLRWQFYRLLHYIFHILAIIGGSIVAALLVDIGGRKFIAMLSSGLLFVTLMVFLFLAQLGIDFEYPYNEGLVNCIYHMGMYQVPFLLIAETYPYKIRATAVAIHLFLFICLELLGRYVNLVIYFDCTISTYYIFCAIFVLAFFFSSWFIMPEVAKRSLFRTQVFLDQFR